MSLSARGWGDADLPRDGDLVVRSVVQVASLHRLRRVGGRRRRALEMVCAGLAASRGWTPAGAAQGWQLRDGAGA